MSSYLLNVFNGLLMKKTLTLSQPKLQFILFANAAGFRFASCFCSSKSRIYAHWQISRQKICKFLCCHSKWRSSWSTFDGFDLLCRAFISPGSIGSFATLKHSIRGGHLERIEITRTRSSCKSFWQSNFRFYFSSAMFWLLFIAALKKFVKSWALNK